ncbi:MAG TPA: sigma-70 family RNA polymerase sigma factor [Verrucomicrobiae bacterium]|nr:sigma-70 family RNA polymerase sigma factor [Verrucomicrobiae bacterium]
MTQTVRPNDALVATLVSGGAESAREEMQPIAFWGVVNPFPALIVKDFLQFHSNGNILAGTWMVTDHWSVFTMDQPAGGGFATTHWSVVLLAGQEHSVESATALEKLCRAYWLPVYAFVRREGHGVCEAEDLTQEFFCRLLARNALSTLDRTKGRFRSFLLASMKHLLANEWNRARRQKRGGGRTILSFDVAEAEDRFRLDPADGLTPENIFDRRWAEALLDRVLDRLEKEFNQQGAGSRFDDLKTFLVDDKGTSSFAQVAERLGATIPALKKVVFKLRRRYRELFREEIAQTVANPSELEEEIRYLIRVLDD